MDRIITYNFREDFIEKLSGFILENFYKKDFDFSKIACIFGGRRPNLFLRRSLSQKIKKPFYPPRVFSIDEFVEYTVSCDKPIAKIAGLEAAYLIHCLTKKISPASLKDNGSFSQFLPWAEEIISFIEQLDLENIDNSALLQIEKSASIGYDIPKNINLLLKYITQIREDYHKALKARGAFSRGLLYLEASKIVEQKPFDEFEFILFCNFFYLHKTELELMKVLWRKNKGILIFQGDQEDWSVFKEHARILNVPIRSSGNTQHEPNLSFSAGFDLHSQICLVREALKEIENKDSTVIVVPRPETVVPLLCEISSIAGDFNISMGYPLKRSSLFALFSSIFKAQENRKNNAYYAHDYLAILRHPLTKNIRLAADPAVTRVLVHKIEEVLTGKVETELGGTLFPTLEAIENLTDIYTLSRDTLRNMGIQVSTGELAEIIKELHRLFFKCWQAVKDFSSFTQALDEIIDILVKKSMLSSFVFNLKVIEKIFSIKEELQALSFNQEPFSLEETASIFLQKLETELISFVGSPLKGLQILGLFETRSLNFENVIILDVNEAVLPKLQIYEPLIPREVMLSLGLNRLEKEEEIQRYQFMRLISSAKNVHLVYEENETKEKSRFIEELFWKKQKELKRLDAISVPKATFNLTMAQPKTFVEKTAQMISSLKKETYSASRLNTYLKCPLQFYYKYVLGFAESEDLLDEPEASDIGKFIHELLEETFKKFLNKKPVINKDFRTQFWDYFDSKFSATLAKRMKSDSLLLKGIIHNRLEKFLELEEARIVDKIICLEKEFYGKLKLVGSDVDFTIQVDRIDQYIDGSLAIIDYKTGSADLVPERLSKLENMELSHETINDNIKSFQLPLYYHFISKHFPTANINAELYSLRMLERKVFISETDYPKRDRVMEICLKALEFIFSEIINPQVPFRPDKNERKCEYCSFTSLCR